MLGLAPLGGKPLGGFRFVTPPTGYTIALTPGAYALAGASATPKAGRILSAFNNLVLNGHFTLDTTNWTVSGANTTFVAADGQGALTLGPAASGGYAWQAVTVVPGRKYRISALLKPSGYALSADPGSYAVSGADVTLTYGTGAAAISDQSLSNTTSGIAAGVGYTLKPDRFAYKTDNVIGETSLERWLPAGQTPGNYSVRATHIAGAAGSGTMGAWLTLDAARNWSLLESSIGTLSWTFMLEIRNSGGTVVDTATITLTATRNS